MPPDRLEFIQRAPLSHHRYRAISYTWGDTSDEKLIEINDQPIHVGENCRRALWQTRLHYPEQLVWIDAICIDQMYLDEKNAQVAIMYDIYAAATATLACLGHARDFNVFADARRIWHERMSLRAESEDEREDEKLTTLRSQWISFCDCDYFSRMWVIQELHAGFRKGFEGISLLVGREQISWRWLTELKQFLDESEPKEWDADPEETFHFSRLHDMVSREQILLKDLTRLAPRFACSDLRDHVYGCLSILASGSAKTLDIRPDYRKFRVQLAEDVAAYLEPSHGSCLQPGDVALIAILLGINYHNAEIRTAFKQKLYLPQEPDITWKLGVDAVHRRVSAGADGHLQISTSHARPVHRGESLPPQPTRTSSTPIFNTAGAIVALACPNIQPGDLIVKANPLGLTLFNAQFLTIDFYFVLRPKSKSRASDVIGRALVRQGLWAPDDADVVIGEEPSHTPPKGDDFINLELGLGEALLLISQCQSLKDEAYYKLNNLRNVDLHLDIPTRQATCDIDLEGEGAQEQSGLESRIQCSGVESSSRFDIVASDLDSDSTPPILLLPSKPPGFSSRNTGHKIPEILDIVNFDIPERD